MAFKIYDLPETKLNCNYDVAVGNGCKSEAKTREIYGLGTEVLATITMKEKHCACSASFLVLKSILKLDIIFVSITI